MALVGNISGSVQSNSEIGLSGTIIIANQPDSTFPGMPGTNVTFFVSGSANTDTDVSVFGGDLTVSGSFIGLGDLLEVSGTLAVTDGISGSLTTLADGTSYLIEGANITITSQSNGSIVISSTGGGGGGNEFFESTVVGSIFTTGSVAFVDQEAVTSPADKGTDVFFYVSGSEGSKDGPTPGVALFGGDIVVSGSLTLPSNFLQVTGTLEVTNGISGSLTQLTDGTSYLIAGNNISVVSQSNGSILISNTFSQADDYFDSTTAGSIFTTGSTAFVGQEAVASPSDKGTDVFFYVSGSVGSKDTAVPGVALFGGDVVISGSVYSEGNKFEMTGTLEVTNGISGSLTHLTDGTSYLIAGDNAQITSQSNGSVLINAVPTGTGNEIQYNNAGSFEGSSNFEFDGSTVYLTGSLEVGNNSKANGLYSLAQGLDSNANAQHSIAMGRDVTSTAQFAFAHGDTTLAAGTASHAEGRQTKAYGQGSHAEGELTETDTTAAYSHAEGYYTITSASHQHAEGRFNLRNNNHSLLVIGNGTGDDNSLRSDVVRVEMDSVQISGSLLQRNSGSSLVGFMGDDSAMIPTQKGTDVFFYVSGSTAAARSNASLFGGFVVISGSMTQGNFGASGGSTGQYSRAHGERTTASGASSHSEGRFALAQGPNSHAEGDSTATYGASSHAEGLDSAAFANYSHAEGRSTEARGLYSHTEGYDSISRADYSHAEGRDTETIAGADYSHAEGSGSIAVGIASHAGGLCTIASGSNQTVFGQYNLRGNTTSLFVIGNGTADSNDNRSDVIRVLPGTLGVGQLQVSGSLSVSGSYSGNTDDLSGPGTIPSNGHSMLLRTTGNSQAVTLSDGIWPGQLKYVVANSNYGGAGNTTIVTPTNPLGYSSVAFGADGQAVTFFWTGSKWVIVGSYGATINP